MVYFIFTYQNLKSQLTQNSGIEQIFVFLGVSSMCVTVRSPNKVFHKSTFLYHWFGNVYFAKKQPTKEKKNKKNTKHFLVFKVVLSKELSKI